MKNIYKLIFSFFTNILSYGIAVALFSILWSGIFTILNLVYLVPILSQFFDFSSEWFLLLRILFVLPFPTLMILYGAFSRLGIPAALPSFRLANKHIYADGDIRIRDGLTEKEYLSLLRSINRIPVIFFIVALIEVAYIDIIVLIVALYNQYSFSTIAWIFTSWVMQTVNYGGVGYVLAETVTGRMRRECKMKLRHLKIPHELKTKSSVIYKMAIIASMMLFTLVLSIAMTYLRRADFSKVLTYIIIYTSVIALLSFLTMRVFYRALYDVGRVVENLKECGEGIIYTSSLDNEIIELAAGINSASDTITDYRLNLEQKVDERTKELSEAKDEIEAAMEELEAMNENLVKVNRELEESNVRYKKDMSMAANLQAAFLPRRPPQSEEYDIALIYKPMSGVSGDFYDFYLTDGRIDGAGIFDVSGHGISSGLLTLLARSVIEKNFRDHHKEKLGALMNGINKSLINEIGQTGYYITGIILRFRNSTVEYANSGHPHMVYKAARTKNVGRVMSPNGESIIGPFLGIDLMDISYKSLTIKFNPGDCLLLYTDSLSETKNPDGAPYEESRILKCLKEAPDGSAQEILDSIMKDFYNFTQKTTALGDDITAILIKRK